MIRKTNSDEVNLPSGHCRIRRAVAGILSPLNFMYNAILVFRITGLRNFVVEALIDVVGTDDDRTIYTAVIQGTPEEVATAELGFYIRPVFFPIVE